ncbi:MAG: UDP-N-acetylmuramate--L-alanine ligase [Candidatus Colwellbacteria bacterium]|nr:UDP-N-acetylmuramate--L-alanine ligase [Candidatus Colwellbacteria bacterium]
MPSPTKRSINVRPAKDAPKKALPRRVHFVGIGGIGMSSLSRWFLAQKWLVTGSDATKSSITQELVRDGITVKIGHKEGNLPKNTELVVASAAVPMDNPELALALKLGIKVQKYSEALGDVTRQYKTIAICGSHGKSSTTAMVASIFIKAKLDPTVIIGTKLDGWNFRAGHSEWLIIEADEYTGAFWNYKPWSAIVTNIDLEHVDFYKNLAAVKASFLKFLSKAEGYVIANKDNKNSFDVSQKIKKAEVVYFTAEEKGSVEMFRNILKVPGVHNIMNAMAAWKLAIVAGIDQATALKALASYKGVWRRLEYKGSMPEGIKIFDDYAHHPTEIKASLQAMREKFPKSHLVCVFQPHQSRRLVALYKDFVASFDDADSVLTIDTYNPKGRDEVSQNISAESLAHDINKRSEIFDMATYIGTPKNIRKGLKDIVKNKGLDPKKMVAVLMGAGDVSDETGKLVR